MKAPLLIGAIGLSLLLGGCAAQPAPVSQSQASTADVGHAPGTKETSSATTKPEAPVQTVDKYTVGQLEKMPSAQFNELDFKDKAPYVKHLLKDSNDRLIFYTAPGTKLYKYNPLDIASETNTPQEIAMQIWYTIQLPYAQPQSRKVGDYTLDTENAQKALSAGFYTTTGPNVPASYAFIKNEIESGTPAGGVKDNYTDAKEVKPLTEVTDDQGNKIQVKTISLLDNGVEQVIDVTLRQIDEDTSVWQIYQQRAVAS